MGGKGQRRREKNYRAAHEGYSRLPPPPDKLTADVLPSKLRKLIAFTSSTTQSRSQGSIEESTADGRRKKTDGSSHEKEIFSTYGSKSSHVGVENGRNKKRKRKEVKDLRFEVKAEELAAVQSKKKERKKKFLEAKKEKKNKKKWKGDDNVNFAGREEIKFGEVVVAPPKLGVVPNVKTAVRNRGSVFQERRRLEAIGLYRNRKGWVGRLGIELPIAPTF